MPLTMLCREAPLSGIREGLGKVMCLDVLRTLAREPRAREALELELHAFADQDVRCDEALRAYRAQWRGLPAEVEARWFVDARRFC